MMNIFLFHKKVFESYEKLQKHSQMDLVPEKNTFCYFKISSRKPLVPQKNDRFVKEQKRPLNVEIFNFFV